MTAAEGYRFAPVINVSVEPRGMPGLVINMSSQVISMTYEDCSDKADKLSIIVDNADLEQFSLPLWQTGNFIRVTWGYPEALAPERRTQIRKITGFRQLKIEAYGGELLLAREARLAVWPGKGGEPITRSEVAKKIAERFGYRDAEHLQWIEDTTLKYPAIYQRARTDLQFINELARAENFDFYIDYDGFHFHSKGWLAKRTNYSPTKTFVYNSDVSQIEILSAEISNDITLRAGSVTAKSWDSMARQGITLSRTQASPESIAALAAILEAPGMGEWDVPGMGHFGHHEVIHSPRANANEVAAAARNELERQQREAVKMKVRIVGDPTLLAKTVVTIKGMGSRLSQDYWVKAVEHQIGNGYVCTAELISSGSHGHSTVVTTPIGVIRIQPNASNPIYKGGVTRDNNGIDIRDPKTGKELSPEEVRARSGVPEPAKGAPENISAQPAESSPAGPTQPDEPNSSQPEARVDPKAPKGLPPQQRHYMKLDDDSFYGVLDDSPLPPTENKELTDPPKPAEIAEQQQLEAAYHSLDSLPDAEDEDHTRSYLYKEALTPGNVDLDNRPVVKFKDDEGNESVATIFSKGFPASEGSTVQVLVPSVSPDGRILTDEEAFEQYETTGQHLGYYKDAETSDRAAVAIHEDQALNPPNNTLEPRVDRPLTREERRLLGLTR